MTSEVASQVVWKPCNYRGNLTAVKHPQSESCVRQPHICDAELQLVRLPRITVEAPHNSTELDLLFPE